jgi:hypothetical protein
VLENRHIKTGTFYFAQNRNFLLCLDSEISPVADALPVA